MRRHADSNNVVILAVFLEIQRVMALMSVDNEQSVDANYPLLCMRIKVLQPLKTELISRPAVLRDSNNPVMRYIAVLVPA